MGGDHGPKVTLAACRQFLDQQSDASLILVGLAEQIGSFSHPRATIVIATEVVTMDDPLEIALRRKKDSSMRVAIEQVKEGKAQAAVSAGNTGALMAISRYVLKTLDGIERPAIAGQIPNATGGATTVLDLGRECRLHGRTLAAICRDGLGPGVGTQKCGDAFGRIAQYWRRSH